MLEIEGNMKITLEAKDLLLDALKKNEANCVLVREFKSCCGTQLNFSLSNTKEGDKVEMIEGVSFMMDASAILRTEKVTLQAENGQLFVHDESEKEEGCC
jgi:hypothetical protein